MSNAQNKDQASKIEAMQAVLEEQKSAFLAKSYTSLEERIDRLQRLRIIFADGKQEFAEAISKDFTNRSIHETYVGEIQTILDHIDETIKHLPKWIKNEPRVINKLFLPAKGWVQYQPLGVVGIISPWNYPIVLSMGPLISALAAGNHAMLKPSSAVPNFTKLLSQKITEKFEQSLVHVVEGSGALSKAFSKMNFDQMTFTGSSKVGKVIMNDASENLTPVLLELGGKSPALVHESFDIEDFAVRFCIGKIWNAGQTCVAPDYVLLPKGKTQAFVNAVSERIAKCYPTLVNNPDYTSIINQSAKDNLIAMREDAKEKGATIVECNPANENFEGTQKLPPTFVYDTTEDMRICQEEIFGPLILVKEYETMKEAVAYIRSKPHPLALYYFDFDEARAEYIAENTLSGHFGINQVLTHVAQDGLPFGGVGNSGMGKYHGMDGFKAMSNARSVMKHGSFYTAKYLAPPFTKLHDVLLKSIVK